MARERKILNSKEQSNISPLANTQKLFQGLLQRVPITLNVIKSICDATLNAARGEVSLKPKEKMILASHRKLIERLIQRGETAELATSSQSNNGIHFRTRHTHSPWSGFIHFGPEIILVVMTGKFTTITLIEEAEFDRLPQRQIKDYNPAFN